MAEDCRLTVFAYDLACHLLTVEESSPPLQPNSVTIAGSFQSELGCSGDWQPDCTETELQYDAEDNVWQAVFAVPAGNWEYKAALNAS